MACLLPALAHGQEVPPPGAIVCWQEHRKLTLDDFQAPRRPDLASQDSVAGTFLGAVTQAKAVVYDVLQTGVRQQTSVSVEFSKTGSWLNRTTPQDLAYTLAHEQLHFDIVELTGRKIRRVLAHYTAIGKPLDGPDITAEISCIYEEEADLQNLYEEETRAGNDVVQQGRWTALVHRSLQQFSRYTSTAADCVH